MSSIRVPGGARRCSFIRPVSTCGKKSVPTTRTRASEARAKRLAVATVNLGLGSLPQERLKYASGLFNMLRNLGGAVGIALRGAILQIHDELLFEGPEEETADVERIAIEQMGGAFEMDPPLAVEVGVGPDWLAAK